MRPSTAFKNLSAVLLFLLLSAPTFSSLAEPRVQVINPPDLRWEERVRHRIEWVERFLCGAFEPLPASVQIVRNFSSPEYDLSLGMIFIDQDYLPVELYHEYAHRMLDAYMDRRSEAIGYFKLRWKMHGRPLGLAARRLQREADYDRRFLAELKQRSHLKLAANLRRYMAHNRQLLLELESTVQREPRFGPRYARYAGQTDAPSLYQLLAPYHELFADTVSVLITGRWSAVLMASETKARRPAERFGFVGGAAAMENRIREYRAFKRNIRLDRHRFNRLESQSRYAQFLPSRSAIRKLAETGYRANPVLLVRVLAESIYEEVEERLGNPGLYQMSLRAMNRRLIDRLAARVVAQADRPGALLAVSSSCGKNRDG